jgi:hypothetical protein
MPKAQLIITLTDQGQIEVNGPLSDKILCYGMLKFAENVIQSYEPPKIAIPNFIPPKNLKGN